MANLIPPDNSVRASVPILVMRLVSSPPPIQVKTLRITKRKTPPASAALGRLSRVINAVAKSAISTARASIPPRDPERKTVLAMIAAAVPAIILLSPWA